MKNGYVSEFTLFMNQYLAEHPQVVEDQERGWDIYWNRKVDQAALEKARQDSVSDDGYGFHPRQAAPGEGLAGSQSGR